jgi:23S rRNA pseudouridine2605 synthase
MQCMPLNELPPTQNIEIVKAKTPEWQQRAARFQKVISAPESHRSPGTPVFGANGKFNCGHSRSWPRRRVLILFCSRMMRSAFMTIDRDPLPGAKDSERIAKVIARAGLCSRREAERWILDGRVSVNGKMLDSPAFTVGADDRIVVDGKPLPASEAPRLFLYHKPVGLVTTMRDEKNRPTVFANLPRGLPRVVSVGRLDLNSEGLLLLTNDGGLARYLELPANALKRRYRARVHGSVKPADLARLAKGVTVDGVNYGPIEARLERAQSGTNSWLVVTLKEGKNREIRKVMAHLGLQVSRLIRTGYGPFELGDLPAGSAQEVESGVLKARLANYFQSSR